VLRHFTRCSTDWKRGDGSGAAGWKSPGNAGADIIDLRARAKKCWPRSAMAGASLWKRLGESPEYSMPDGPDFRRMDRKRFIRTSAVTSLGLLFSCGFGAVSFARAPRKVLVFGGTDFVGPAVVNALMADGHTVTIFNRGVTKPELFPHVEKLKGFRSADPNDQDLSALARRRFDVVIDVCLTTRMLSRQRLNFSKIGPIIICSCRRWAHTITSFSQSRM
jgi:NAD-dependent epimerase/dehydratase family protein